MKNLPFITSSLIIATLLMGSSPVSVNAQTPTPTMATKIQNFGDRITGRLTAVLDRAENLRARVLERANSIQTPKFDLLAVNQSLTEAAVEIAAGRQKVAAMTEAIAKARAASSAAKTPREKAMGELRAAMRAVMADVRLAHWKTVKAIIMIRNAYLPPAPTTPPPTETSEPTPGQ